MILGLEPHRNSLAISLIDPVVFLRGVDFSRGRHENSSPSILRGLLTLYLTKPTRISSIEVELIGQSVTSWSEGIVFSLYARQMNNSQSSKDLLFAPWRCERSRSYFLQLRPSSKRLRAPLAAEHLPSTPLSFPPLVKMDTLTIVVLLHPH